MNKFAPNFKPMFRASTLAPLCKYPSEKTQIRFALNFVPFSKYRHRITSLSKSSSTDSSKSTSIELKSRDKDIIRNELSNQFADETFQFDDRVTLKRVCEKTSFQPEWDDDSNETKFEHKRMKKVDSNNNETEPNSSASFNVQDQLYKDKCELNEHRKRSALSRYICIERGNQLETRIIEKVNAEENFNFVQDKTLLKMDLGYFYLCGIPDGIDEARKTLIEVKTRSGSSSVVGNKQIIKLDDKFQCLAYMKLTNCVKCLLVESRPDGTQIKSTIEWDEEEFEERIDEPLKAFVIKFRNMRENEFQMKLRKFKFKLS